MGSGLLFSRAEKDLTPTQGWGQVSRGRESNVSRILFCTAMSDSLVTVAQFHGSTDAAVAKRAMDTAGIESEVEDVRLEVHNEDAYRAFGVLDTDCPALPVVEEAYEPASAMAICAACGSADRSAISIAFTSDVPM